MATLLDVGVLGHFAPIFTFLLVYVLAYAVLAKTEPWGDNKGVYALIAVILAAMTLFFPPVVALITYIAPWFVFMLFMIFVIMLLFMAFGVKAGTFEEIFKKDKLVMWVVLAFSIAILLLGLSQVFGHVISGTGDGDGEGGFNEEVTSTIFHPKVLGIIFLFIIGALAVKLLSSVPPA